MGANRVDSCGSKIDFWCRQNPFWWHYNCNVLAKSMLLATATPETIGFGNTRVSYSGASRIDSCTTNAASVGTNVDSAGARGTNCATEGFSCGLMCEHVGSRPYVTLLCNDIMAICLHYSKAPWYHGNTIPGHFGTCLLMYHSGTVAWCHGTILPLFSEAMRIMYLFTHLHVFNV